MEDKKRSSVEIDSKLFHEFKILCVKNDFSLHKLVNKGIYLYIKDKEFRDKLETIENLNI